MKRWSGGGQPERYKQREAAPTTGSCASSFLLWFLRGRPGSSSKKNKTKKRRCDHNVTKVCWKGKMSYNAALWADERWKNTTHREERCNEFCFSGCSQVGGDLDTFRRDLTTHLYAWVHVSSQQCESSISTNNNGRKILEEQTTSSGFAGLVFLEAVRLKAQD